MKKTLSLYSVLVNLTILVAPLYANVEKCIPSYVQPLLQRSTWEKDLLVDHIMGYSYAVTNLTTKKGLMNSSSERLALVKSNVLSTEFDEASKACIAHLKMENGKELSLKLKYKKLKKL